MRRHGKRGAVVVTAVVAVLAVGIPAWAYFALSSSSTNATATARTLGAPVLGTTTATPTSVAFAVSAPASGPAPTGYRVDRTGPSAVTGVCTLPAAGGTCTDPAPVGGQTNTYAAYALLGGWASLTPATVTANVPAGSFTVTPATTTPTAGTAFSVTITARAGAATDTSYSGSKTLQWSGGQTVGAFAPAYPGTVTFTNGVATASVTLHRAGAQTLTVTDANAAVYTGSASVTVSAAQPRLAFSTCNATHPRNSSFTTTVTRTGTDPYGNPTGTAAITVALAPTGGNAKFTAASTTIANGALASPVLTVNTASGAGTTTSYTATVAGYVTATCSVTTA